MLRPQALPPIPEETARVDRAAFPKGHPYLNPARRDLHQRTPRSGRASREEEDHPVDWL